MLNDKEKNMEYKTVRTETEINEVLNICSEREEKGETRHFSSTHEIGVQQAILWLIGDIDEFPVKYD